MEVVSVECIDTLDPKVVRVTISLGGTTLYVLDIPHPLYPDIGAALGWPLSPCAE